MSGNSKTVGRRHAPTGVRYAAEEAERRFRIPAIAVRCRKQSPGEAPLFVRPRFGWDRREISGAFGDLGTFLPHIVGAITIVGMAPAGILTTFGLFYIFTGAFYGLPVAVQPMKAASAVVLVEPMAPETIAGAGLAIGLFFLIAGVTGLIDRIARVMPPVVASGLQLGLGLSLAGLGLTMVLSDPWLGAAIGVMTLLMLRFAYLPAALTALVVGTVVGRLFEGGPPFPALELGFHLPSLILPNWHQIADGFQKAALPQIPLTLTNAIIVTAAVARRLFPREVHEVTERNLSITTGLGNLVAAPFGGYPMCHGAGGLAGHHRFGARSASAPLLIGIIFVAFGIALGDGAFDLLRIIPDAVLGVLLAFSGLELALSSEPQRYRNTDLFLVLAVGTLAVAVNPALAFMIGLAAAYAISRRLPRS